MFSRRQNKKIYIYKYIHAFNALFEVHKVIKVIWHYFINMYLTHRKIHKLILPGIVYRREIAFDCCLKIFLPTQHLRIGENWEIYES